MCIPPNQIQTTMWSFVVCIWLGGMHISNPTNVVLSKMFITISVLTAPTFFLNLLPLFTWRNKEAMLWICSGCVFRFCFYETRFSQSNLCWTQGERVPGQLCVGFHLQALLHSAIQPCPVTPRLPTPGAPAPPSLKRRMGYLLLLVICGSFTIEHGWCYDIKRCSWTLTHGNAKRFWLRNKNVCLWSVVVSLWRDG